LQVFWKPQGDGNWLLPIGGTAEQVGERENGHVLVWAEPATAALDEQRVSQLLGSGSMVRRLGKNLFVAKMAEKQAAIADVESDPEEISPVEQAKKLLADARLSGDCLKQASPLIDLGVICLRGGKVPQAVELLQRALAIAQKFGDQVLISDAQTNLAAALLASGQAEKAREFLEAELVRAREGADRFYEKTVLGHLAAVHAKLDEREQAIQLYESALSIARQLSDQSHEAELCWFLAIQNAEWGRREQALANGKAAIELWKQLGNPHADEYSKSLEKYRLDESANNLTSSVSSGGPGSDAIEQKPISGPSLLRMAMSAARAATLFLTSGLATVAKAEREKRLETCKKCPHHTGVRCRLCGCFTRVKARLPHERCPIAKWGAG
jgi:tetratricopeptide (TPR) repeat protein